MRTLGLSLLIWIWAGIAVAQALAPAAQAVAPAAQAVVQAYRDKAELPLVSQLAAPGYNSAAAYQTQRAAVGRLLDAAPPFGFKAGLTGRPVQQRFGVDEPVAGVLLPGAPLAPHRQAYPLHRADYRAPMLELELGYRLRQTIERPLASVADLKALVAVVMPVVEVPELGFANLNAVTVPDIIANNVGARRVVVGPARAVGEIDVNALEASLRRGGTAVSEGVGQAALGDQWQALLWLVNRTVASGWRIGPDQVLITGAMGKVVPAEPGNYVADFGPLGELQLRVQ